VADSAGQDEELEQADESEIQDLRESAEAMGVEGAASMDPQEVLEEARHAQADSEASPSGWKADREEGDDRQGGEDTGQHTGQGQRA
jgi:hypothetical protein